MNDGLTNSPRATDPETSRIAAQANSYRPKHRAAVREQLELHPGGLTDAELHARLQWITLGSINTARLGLERLGYAYRTDERRLTGNKRPAIVFKALRPSDNGYGVAVEDKHHRVIALTGTVLDVETNKAVSVDCGADGCVCDCGADDCDHADPLERIAR